ncbi:MAG: MauE/DoxX family redox-associated membrane protein [bacterium]
MRRIIDNDLLTLAMRLFVGITFVYSSIYKVIDPNEFARSIWFYHMVPGDMINMMALLMAWAELFCGIFILIGFWYRGAVLLVNTMVVMFIVALVSAGIRGIDIDCGCFKPGQASQESILTTLWFDLGLIVATVWLWFSASGRWMIQRHRRA